MPESNFPFDECLLKHFVRYKGWLPSCKRRLKAIQSDPKKARRLRYFTFCAVGAVDVLMLDVANVIRRSASDRFDTVVFFDKSEELVLETKKRIPGAIGFTGDFTDVVLLEDPNEELVVDSADPLSPPADSQDKRATRQRQATLGMRQAYIQEFPFDIINLDLQDFLFRPKDPMPGKIVNALRRILEWQKRTRKIDGKGKIMEVDEFCLMFTTQVGPPVLGEDYREMLISSLDRNIARDTSLGDVLYSRTGHRDGQSLYNSDFAQFFKVSVPKALLAVLLEEDWYADPKDGLKLFEFDRDFKGGTYKMLHFVLTVKRQNPKKTNRSPGVVPAEAIDAYAEMAKAVFTNDAIVVSDETIAPLKAELEKNFTEIKARRKKYYPFA